MSANVVLVSSGGARRVSRGNVTYGGSFSVLADPTPPASPFVHSHGPIPPPSPLGGFSLPPSLGFESPLPTTSPAVCRPMGTTVYYSTPHTFSSVPSFPAGSFELPPSPATFSLPAAQDAPTHNWVGGSSLPGRPQPPPVMTVVAQSPTHAACASPHWVPGSPVWTAVAAPKRRIKDPSRPRPPEPQAPPTQQASAGEAVDLYYDKKELFYRGWTHKDQQSWSTTAKVKTAKQVNKRRVQAMRARGWDPDADSSDDGAPEEGE